MHMTLTDPVARAFSAAAASYDHEASLQRAVGHELLRQLPESLAVASWLDLGCGTGYFCRQLQNRHPQALGLAVDIAPGMLQQARTDRPGPAYLCGDAQALPLAGASVDLVFSSLALQWCADFSMVLDEIYRVLKPGGICVFSSLASGTLHELSTSWQQACSQPRVNRFRSFARYRQLCGKSSLQADSLYCRATLQHYPDVRSVNRHLKGIGAQHLQNGQRRGLLGRAAWQRMQDAYEELRQPAGLPVTWQVVYGVLRKV